MNATQIPTECPVVGCKVEGSLPGIKRHMLKTHGMTHGQIANLLTARPHWTDLATEAAMLTWLRKNGRFLRNDTKRVDLVIAIRAREAKLADALAA
jgi:hypothetical protein